MRGWDLEFLAHHIVNQRDFQQKEHVDKTLAATGVWYFESWLPARHRDRSDTYGIHDWWLTLPPAFCFAPRVIYALGRSGN